jgi:hypothetical protein
MKVRFQDFDSEAFSFHKDPVLVVEEFWTPQEAGLFFGCDEKNVLENPCGLTRGSPCVPELRKLA